MFNYFLFALPLVLVNCAPANKSDVSNGTEGENRYHTTRAIPYPEVQFVNEPPEGVDKDALSDFLQNQVRLVERIGQAVGMFKITSDQVSEKSTIISKLTLAFIST